ncbi:MAG: Lrp/AsnC family transcriptional regulator [Synergistaceae bacterium]|jgi:Lrp/AsnC family leucine-responsive transcriptional regulator|nr:Lrp/AsnC family transcriptional regulator [Synergistaceae bacterium]
MYNKEGFKALDEIGTKILMNLQKNARIPFSELARIVGLSSPAVAERVHRLEESGYITKYHAVVDPDKMGFPIIAFINMTMNGLKLKDINEKITSIPEIAEAYHLAGDYGIMLKVLVSSASHLGLVINKLNSFAETTTSVVLSSPVKSRELAPTCDKRES